MVKLLLMAALGTPVVFGLGFLYRHATKNWYKNPVNARLALFSLEILGVVTAALMILGGVTLATKGF